MKKLKIFKIVIIGFLLIYIPFIFAIIYMYNHTLTKDYLFYILILSTFMLYYWSYFSPLYKYYSIKELENKSEYDYWYKISMRSLVLCSKKSYFNKLECWDVKKLRYYKKTKKKLTQNEI